MVTMHESERIVNSLDTNTLLEIDGVLDVVDPVELNALIIVMSNGKRYKMLVEEYDEQAFFVMPILNY